MADELDRVMRSRGDAARRAATRDREVAERARADALRRRPRITIERGAESTLITITAATENVVVLRVLGAALLALLAFCLAFAGSMALAVAVALLLVVAAASWRPRPYRIRIAGGAFAVEGRRGRLRYVAPICELSMRMRYGVLVVGTDRRLEFYGVSHPHDIELVGQLQRELDAIRRS